MKFEVHITSKDIDKLYENYLHIENLSPTLRVINEVKLSEYIIDVEDEFEAIEYIESAVARAEGRGIRIDRYKLECKPSKNVNAVYYEVHLPYVKEDVYLPISRNVKKNKLIQTLRSKNLEDFGKFNREKVECCVFDSNLKEDDLWFRSYYECLR